MYICGQVSDGGRAAAVRRRKSYRPAVWSLLLPPPDDDHARGIRRCQQALVTVEAHVQNGTPVTLQLVNYGLGVALHVKEVYAAVLAAGYLGGGRNQDKYRQLSENRRKTTKK